MIWGLWEIPKPWLWVLGIVGGLVMAGLVVLLIWVVIQTGPAAVEQWNTADARERDTVILLVVIVSWLTRSTTKCKCQGGCSKP